jgi:hypothetical protein
VNRPLDFLLKLAGPYPAPWEDCAKVVLAVAALINTLALWPSRLRMPDLVSGVLSWLWPVAGVVIVAGLARVFAQYAALRRRSLASTDFSSPLKRLQRW